MSDEPSERDVGALRREARKHGTDSPHEPTDEFVRHAFAEGARYLWPDGRDPGWFVTFDRWFAERIAEARREGAVEVAERVERALLHTDPVRIGWTSQASKAAFLDGETALANRARAALRDTP